MILYSTSISASKDAQPMAQAPETCCIGLKNKFGAYFNYDVSLISF